MERIGWLCTNIKTQTDNKVKNLTKPVGTKSDNTQTCKPISNYDKYTLDKPSATTVNYSDVISIISTNTDNKIRYAVFAKMYLSSSNGSKLQTVGHNYSGVDLNPYWGATGDTYFMTKYYCDSSNSPDGKSQTAYAIFNSVNDHINFLIDRYSKRVSMIKTIDAKDIAKFLILYSDNGIPKNEDEYTTMNPTDITNIESRVQEAINIINPVTGNVSAIPPPANVPQPPSYLKIVNLGTFDSLQGNDYSYRNIQQTNGKYIVLKIEDPNFTFDKLGSTTFLDANNQSIGYGCSGGSGALTCTVNGKASGVYTMVQEYYPYKPQNWDKFEIRSVPFTQ